MKDENLKARGYALIPFVIFVLFYLSSGIIAGDFYAIPTPISVIIGIIIAFLIFKRSVDNKFNTFIRGCGDKNIIIMCLIYLLAGAFSSVSEAMGGVESTVNFGISIIPPQFIAAGIFVIGAFVSLSTGTSVGTIATVTPIALGFSQKAGIDAAFIIGALIGGAMFGDNLSIISDTTIAATATQNVDMKDKFRMNIKIALPAAIITFFLFLILARPEHAATIKGFNYSFIRIIPYLVVLMTALLGMNVFLVLTLGVILSAGIGLFEGSFTVVELFSNIYGGFNSMFEIFLLSMLTGGLAYLVTEEGGINWIIKKASGFIKSQRSCEIGVFALVSLLDCAVANNTVAIIIAGPVVKELSNKFKVDPRRTASLLDTFSCIMQGFIPYGAQVLFAAKATEGLLSPFDLMPYFWYQFILFAFAILSIIFKFPRTKDKWNFEKDCLEK
ncbi:MAG: Na+/H+ antiporter NhaC family protein [Tissierellia bacterium]|nr:Na+/H+ antiporter NhaC family protein [Tissierellia bacterium]